MPYGENICVKCFVPMIYSTVGLKAYQVLMESTIWCPSRKRENRSLHGLSHFTKVATTRDPLEKEMA